MTFCYFADHDVGGEKVVGEKRHEDVDRRPIGPVAAARWPRASGVARLDVVDAGRRYSARAQAHLFHASAGHE